MNDLAITLDHQCIIVAFGLLDRKADMDAANPAVQEWETLMWRYQEALPSAKPGQKWVPMKKVFQLEETD